MVVEEGKILILLHLLPRTSEKETIMVMDLQLDMAVEATTTPTTVVIIQDPQGMAEVPILMEEEEGEAMEEMETITLTMAAVTIFRQSVQTLRQE